VPHSKHQAAQLRLQMRGRVMQNATVWPLARITGQFLAELYIFLNPTKFQANRLQSQPAHSGQSSTKSHTKPQHISCKILKTIKSAWMWQDDGKINMMYFELNIDTLWRKTLENFILHWYLLF
jgi:hypothetical protein